MSFVQANRNVLSTLIHPSLTFDEVFPKGNTECPDVLALAMDIALHQNRNAADASGKIYISHDIGSTDALPRYHGTRLVNRWGTPLLRINRNGNYTVESYVSRLRDRIRPNTQIESEKRSYILTQLRKRMNDVLVHGNDICPTHARSALGYMDNACRDLAFRASGGQQQSSRSINIEPLNYLLLLATRQITEGEVPVHILHEIDQLKTSVGQSLGGYKATQQLRGEMYSKSFWGVQYHPGHGFTLYKLNPIGTSNSSINTVKFDSLLAMQPTYYRNLSHLEHANPAVHADLMVAMTLVSAGRTDDWRKVGDVNNEARGDDIAQYIKWGDFGSNEPCWNGGWYSESTMSRGHCALFEVL